MVFLYRVLQSRPQNVRINLRGRDVGVSQHGLQAAQVGTTLQEVGGETMAQDVGREPAENSGLAAVARQQFPKPLPCEAAAAGGYKEVAAGSAFEQGAPPIFQIVLHGLN